MRADDHGMGDDDAVGARIAAYRKAHGYTGRALAAEANVSYSLLSKVETGRVPASTALVTAVARVLGMSVTTLYGQPYRATPPGRDPVHAAIAPLRREALAYQLPPEDTDEVVPRTLSSIAVDVTAANAMRHGADFTALGEVLPGLLTELRLALHTASDPGQQRAAARLLLPTYFAAEQLTYKLGYDDLSAIFSERYLWAAAQAEDPLAVAIGLSQRAGNLSVAGDHALARHILTSAQTTLGDPDPADVRATSVWGWLHLKQSLTAARAGDTDRVWDHHTAAVHAAARLDADNDLYGLYFGPTNTHLWEVALAVEVGDHGRALTRAQATHIPTDAPPERSSHYWIDLARAHLTRGDRHGVLNCLTTARDLAPQHVRFHPMVRQTLHAVAAADRRATGDLARFAHWVGVDL